MTKRNRTCTTQGVTTEEAAIVQRFLNTLGGQTFPRQTPQEVEARRRESQLLAALHEMDDDDSPFENDRD
jgi:hypothetical protein